MISPVGTSEINKRSGDVFFKKREKFKSCFCLLGFLKCGFKKRLTVLRTVALF